MILEKREYKLGIRYGIILGIIVVTIGITRYTTGMIFNEDQRLSYLYWVIFLIASLFSVTNAKKSNNEFSLKHAIKLGITIGFVSSSIYLLYLIVLNYFVDPELPEKLIEISRQRMMGQNNELTSDQIKEIDLKKSSSNPIVRGVIYIVVSTFFGIIYSSMGWIIVKLKNRKR
ncbi:DUF4199 domain-containing protein [Pontimicrobium sp. SW4]|uniref:DUF4199 domain-containing protein n=1 Tax=Pontimicrobium sp. SW4 TaxID=3153519 RepID=A0AAU7BQC4_9FLAO